jgi:hypothetical protein
MSKDQLWETTQWIPKSRILKRISITDALEAEAMFTVLMGRQGRTETRFYTGETQSMSRILTFRHHTKIGHNTLSCGKKHLILRYKKPRKYGLKYGK